MCALSENPLISVIVPVYNVAAYLPYCLESLIHNTYRRLEIICVNDGSTDGSAAILADYALRDSRIRVVNKENGGVSRARNLGLDMATGEWIAFLDSDDALHIRHFECLLEAWEQTGRRADIVVSGTLWHEEGELPPYDAPLSAPNTARLLSWDGMACSLFVWCFPVGKIIRRELVASVRIPEHIVYAEDTCFSVAVLNACKEPIVAEASAAGYLYRRNPASAVHTKPKRLKVDGYECLLNATPAFPYASGRAFSYAVVVRNMYWLLDFDLPAAERETQVPRCKRICGRALKAWWHNGFCSPQNRREFYWFVCYLYCPPAIKMLALSRRFGRALARRLPGKK